ncbi:hypothetical protein EJB05_51301, partial [Eragrostis curvula]
MTTTCMGAAASGSVGGSPRSTPHGSCADGALDSRNQEMASNSEGLAVPRRQESEAPVGALVLPPPRIQEPVKRKRRHGADSVDLIWLCKKQRSAVAAAAGLGNANRALAAVTPSSPIVREQCGNIDGIGKKSHGALGRSSCGVVDHKEDEKIRSCQFATTGPGMGVLRQDSEMTDLGLSWPLQIVQKPVKHDHHQNGEECWLIKKRCHADMVAACIPGNGPVDRVNSAEPSTPSRGVQEPVSRCSSIQKGKAAARRRATKRSDYNIIRQPFASLSCGLRCLGVANVTLVLAKILTLTDSKLGQARLQLAYAEFMGSPLMSMLTPGEYMAVHTREGLPVDAIDRHGCSYDMRFGFVKLSSGIAYRLRTEWTKFLTRSGVRDGDLVEVGAFRVDGRLMLTLLNYSLDGWISEEMEAANGLSMLSDFKDGT